MVDGLCVVVARSLHGRHVLLLIVIQSLLYRHSDLPVFVLKVLSNTHLSNIVKEIRLFCFVVAFVCSARVC